MAVTVFRAKSEQELEAMGEDDLVAYLGAARRAGDRQASALAVAMLDSAEGSSKGT